MSEVTICQFEVYDVTTDRMRKSRRWGTPEAIEKIAHGKVLEGTATTVDESAVTVGTDIIGLTRVEFAPNARSTGIETQVHADLKRS